MGTPIANTSLHILDARMNPVPLGAPGELYIGGAGVVRGYLERPELTQERFVPETIGGDGRMYRTGDVVRYLLDGRLEFLGRSDHQIKLHGHRIELGEIETALARHPGIEQAVVVVREDNQGQRQLVAYLRNRGTDESDPGTVSASQIEDWKKIWQQVYDDSGRSAESLDTSFNIAGWISSYTGMPIPGEEMKEWVLETTENIAALKPARLLEIGCGMGLLLLRLAPECDLYTGVDFSSSALAMIKSDCDRLGLKQVKLIQTAADDLGAIPSASHDVVVINSVAQYFPNADYLEKVLVTAVEKLKPGGFLFVGDVRNLDLAGAFYVSVELSKVPANMRLSKLREQVARRDRLENELLIAPDYFKAFVKKHGLEGLSVTLKRGAASNEMNDYRYDVVLRKTGGNSVRFNRSARTIDGSAITSVDQLRAALSEESGSVQVTDLLNKRLVESVKAQEQLDSGATGEVSTLRAALAVVQQGALNPQHVYGLNSKFEVNLTFSEKYIDRFDAEFTPQNAASGRFRILPVNADWQTKPLTDYVCVPAITTEGSEQLKELQSMLSDELPYYMVPSAFVFLDTFPLTPNGKVDRKALPVPETTENSAVPDKPSAEPTNALEQIIAQVFQDLLKLVRVDIGDNFFEHGANSLLMMKANNRLQGLIGGPLSLRDLFDYPTVASLAAHICEKDDLAQGTPNAG
ncbi:MAG: AMP-binding protein [Gammaproteobacteria bacterium]|nr:AMP-binding protein [Gammaproteobacteria bacterium]